jgi:uncharacterized protein
MTWMRQPSRQEIALFSVRMEFWRSTRYLAQSRAAWAEVISEPEQFIPTGGRIVVFVHARVRPHNSNEWQEVRLADVYTFRNGKAIQMRAFADRQEALRWVGAENSTP